MKTFKLTMMAAMLAFAGTAMAQKVVVMSAEDITIKAGETATLQVMLNYQGSASEAEICGWNFSLMLPEGIEVVKEPDEDYEPTKKQIEEYGDDLTLHPGYWKWQMNGKGTAANGFVNSNKVANGIQAQLKTDGGVLFVAIDQQDKSPLRYDENYLYSGIALQVTLQANKDVEGTGKIYNVGLTNTDNVSVLLGEIEDAEFGINTSITDGINEIQAVDSDAPAYNLQGIRVNNAKGLIIRDGKKMIVK